MYILIDKRSEKAIVANVKSIIYRYMGINASTFYRLMKGRTYLEYKHYIISVSEVTKLFRKRSNDGFIGQSRRMKEISKVIKDENDYLKYR